jgi:hypothetical protein
MNGHIYKLRCGLNHSPYPENSPFKQMHLVSRHVYYRGPSSTESVCTVNAKLVSSGNMTTLSSLWASVQLLT